MTTTEKTEAETVLPLDHGRGAEPPKSGDRFLWGVVIAGVVLFAALAADALMHGQFWKWDQEIARNIKAHWNLVALWVCAAMTQPGELLWIVFLATVLGLLLLRAGRKRELLVLIIALLGSAVMVTTLKKVIGLPRPITTSYFSLPEGTTFPSGHTAGSTIFFGISAYILSRGRGRVSRVLVVAAAGMGSIAVAISLVYIGAHYVSDVLGAYAFCAAWLAGCVLIDRRLLSRLATEDRPAGRDEK